MSADPDLFEDIDIDEPPELKILEPGTIIADRYKVIEAVGHGGMGVVYKAEHMAMNRLVAMKMMLQQATSAAQDYRRFQREAQAASKLSHPNIVSIFDFGIVDGQAYLCMDYLEGNSLDAVVQNKPLTLDQFRHIFSQACDALQHAHEAGIVHRDIKPSNIMITERRGDPNYVIILDFGLVKMIQSGGDHKLTATNMVLGSPLYMSPEQCRAIALDQRSDIYSLGCVMYEALTGVPPLSADTIFDLMTAHITVTPKTMRDALPGLYVPATLERVIFQAMAKNPIDRFQSMKEMAQAIEESFSGAPDQWAVTSASIAMKKAMVPADAARESGAIRRRKKREQSFVMAGWGVIVTLLVLIISGLLFNSMYKSSRTGDDRISSRPEQSNTGSNTVNSSKSIAQIPGSPASQPDRSKLPAMIPLPATSASNSSPATNNNIATTPLKPMPPPPVQPLGTFPSQTAGQIPNAVPPVSAAISTPLQKMEPIQVTPTRKSASQLLADGNVAYTSNDWMHVLSNFNELLETRPSSDVQLPVLAKCAIAAYTLQDKSLQNYLSNFKELFMRYPDRMESQYNLVYKIAWLSKQPSAGREDISFTEKLLQTSIAGYEKYNPRSDMPLAQMRLELNRVYLEQGKQSEAERLLEVCVRDATGPIRDEAKKRLLEISKRAAQDFPPLGGSQFGGPMGGGPMGGGQMGGPMGGGRMGGGQFGGGPMGGQYGGDPMGGPMGGGQFGGPPGGGPPGFGGPGGPGGDGGPFGPPR